MARPLKPHSPFSDLAELREGLDPLPADLTDGGRWGWSLAVDVIEEDDRFILRADLPGIKPGEVNIEVAQNTLTVSGEREEREEERKQKYVRRERRFGSFHRSMTLPPGVTANEIEASFEDGVLEMWIPKPKREDEAKQAVEIKAKRSS